MIKTLRHLSEQIYSVVLSFYPKSYRREFGKEMQYVYSESIKNAVEEKGILGIINFWFKSALDAGLSLGMEHLENMKGGGNVNSRNKDIIMDNKVFGWLGAGTALLLAVPALLMLFQIPLLDPGSGYEVINWGLFDFAIMGTLIFGTGFIFVHVARVTPRKYRTLLAVGAIFGFLAIWAQLAVGAISQVIEFLI